MNNHNNKCFLFCVLASNLKSNGEDQDAIEIECNVYYVFDGDILVIDYIRIKLALVDTP